MKTLNLAEHYIRKIKDYVEKTIKVQVKPLFKAQVSKNLVDLVTISQKLFILEYKVRGGYNHLKVEGDENLSEFEQRYYKMSSDQISDEIIYLANLCDALLDINRTYIIES